MAIRITRVYTRGGDAGKTSLVGGARVDKDCRKLESYGTVDELLCLVGTARTVLSAFPRRAPSGRKPPVPAAELEAWLRRIQNRLFDAGSILATPAGASYPGMPTLADDDVASLERGMDAMQAVLPSLDSFVLPGGTPANAALHQCRAVCRRAEREALRLAREEAVPPLVLKYLNRLSDWFFVMARYAAWLEGEPEYLWEYGAKRESGAKREGGAKRKGAEKRVGGGKTGEKDPAQAAEPGKPAGALRKARSSGRG